MQLSSLYVAADKFGIIQLKNEIIDTFFNTAKGETTHPPEDEVIKHIYSNTTAGAGLRALMVEMHVWLVNPKWLLEASENFLRSLPEFAIDIVPRMASRLYARIRIRSKTQANVFTTSGNRCRGRIER